LLFDETFGLNIVDVEVFFPIFSVTVWVEEGQFVATCFVVRPIGIHSDCFSLTIYSFGPGNVMYMWEMEVTFLAVEVLDHFTMGREQHMDLASVIRDILAVLAANPLRWARCFLVVVALV